MDDVDEYDDGYHDGCGCSYCTCGCQDRPFRYVVEITYRYGDIFDFGGGASYWTLEDSDRYRDREDAEHDAKALIDKLTKAPNMEASFTIVEDPR